MIKVSTRWIENMESSQKYIELIRDLISMKYMNPGRQ